MGHGIWLCRAMPKALDPRGDEGEVKEVLPGKLHDPRGDKKTTGIRQALHLEGSIGPSRRSSLRWKSASRADFMLLFSAKGGGKGILREIP